ncbi:conserved exported hypothetical protein [Candidatus Accumulibacter aalborgensis]|uniref:FecR protein domain-containing protein n=1 Tax=Candidatus Accumulibacter aalborgensis TaxID=1860102 RepID=A0A1A8XTF7_9PROT|nr:FecR family protein [Candidatus Accumulibacter aalborgensis]SBT08364.1 conserved exported hypothetical protein [Candidatus Accumulibacter aalborgensis]
MNRLLCRSLRWVVVMWALLISAVCAAASVGEVTLSIGTSQIEREGKGQPVVKGCDIAAGDVIRTTANGHVHIRFVDGARVSVRPDSVLHVVEYRYDPADPAESLIKFHLEAGTVRGISGLAAQVARDKFRLNTPLVAIGVKGTDFVTQATANSAIVLVNQGAIVLAPLDSACRAEGFGPCGTSRSRELASSMNGMNGMALVYRQAASEPVFQPVNSLKGTDKVTPILQQERVGSATTATAVADSRNPGAVMDVLAPRSTLVWGRWATNAVPGDDLTTSFMEALSGNKVTVGDGYYFLFRNENAPNFLSTASGVTNFRLQSGAASYRDPSNTLVAASINGGSLSIDFGRRTFTTQLAVTAPSIGTQGVAASGTIDPSTGIFLSTTTGARVAGAVSLDTSQAGYFFSKPVGNGVLTGATLWGR